jgi:hypothetical protein
MVAAVNVDVIVAFGLRLKHAQADEISFSRYLRRPTGIPRLFKLLLIFAGVFGLGTQFESLIVVVTVAAVTLLMIKGQ